jgi:hypothetical protein
MLLVHCGRSPERQLCVAALFVVFVLDFPIVVPALRPADLAVDQLSAVLPALPRLGSSSPMSSTGASPFRQTS